MRLITLLMILFITGCASTPPSEPLPFIYSNVETSGSWEKREYVDELNGNWSRSYVSAPKQSWLSSIPLIFVDTYDSGAWAVGITNGDGYICDTGSLKVRVKFDNNEAYSLDRYRGDFQLARNREYIFLRGDSYSTKRVKSDFLEKLALSDNVIIETRDDCGEVRQNKFDIKGNPHFSAKKYTKLGSTQFSLSKTL